jgi:hypothetical protein
VHQDNYMAGGTVSRSPVEIGGCQLLMSIGPTRKAGLLVSVGNCTSGNGATAGPVDGDGAAVGAGRPSMDVGNIVRDS